MPRLAPDSAKVAEIDAALARWRQGDLALRERWFVHAGDPAMALSGAAAELEETGLQTIMSEVDGLVVVTQTCDIVRSCIERPYVEVAPLVPVDANDLHVIQRGRRPAYASLPALISHGLVVDLDRAMTVEKALVASWERTPGYDSDADARAFAQALARKRLRFAFPDDFTKFAGKLQSRLVGKHEKGTDEGRALRALREIRVQATPAWEAQAVSLMFWFVRDEAEVDWEGRNWFELLDSWLELVPPSGRFVEVHGQVVTLNDLTGAEYVGSDPLDVEHLSSRTRRGELL